MPTIRFLDLFWKGTRDSQSASYQTRWAQIRGPGLGSGVWCRGSGVGVGGPGSSALDLCSGTVGLGSGGYGGSGGLGGRPRSRGPTDP